MVIESHGESFKSERSAEADPTTDLRRRYALTKT
jgi:hypothetical protein